MILYFFLITLLGFLPSLIWLSFYLRKDIHPEPKEMVIKIFILGMGSAVLAAFLGILLLDFSESINLPFFFSLFFQVFVAVALIEEIAKYLPVRFFVLNDPEFDEPIDAMIYMIISGLGFAALENILFLLRSALAGEAFFGTLIVLFGRFISATFLHALASANIGYFLALSILKRRKRIFYFVLGILLSTTLHGIYNFAIKINEDKIWHISEQILLISAGVLLFLVFLTFFQFKKIKKLKSVCEV
ncbi:MAG: PrsW family intramembrane metalloprotease [Candidatus Pacebacteria bacterium]|nr:PrsW family intramembrane metalloprotease [Candidatus Paceibacterota bacterium]